MPALICSHLPRSTATNKGHMHRHHSNTASTCNKHADVILARAKVYCKFPTYEACAAQDMFCFAALADKQLVPCTRISPALSLLGHSKT
jgi:hypothetical protein